MKYLYEHPDRLKLLLTDVCFDFVLFSCFLFEMCDARIKYETISIAYFPLDRSLHWHGAFSFRKQQVIATNRLVHIAETQNRRRKYEGIGNKTIFAPEKSTVASK